MGLRLWALLTEGFGLLGGNWCDSITLVFIISSSPDLERRGANYAELPWAGGTIVCAVMMPT